MDAVESRSKLCDLALTLTKSIIVGYLGLYSICWLLILFLRFRFSIKGHSEDSLLLLQVTIGKPLKKLIYIKLDCVEGVFF